MTTGDDDDDDAFEDFDKESEFATVDVVVAAVSVWLLCIMVAYFYRIGADFYSIGGTIFATLGLSTMYTPEHARAVRFISVEGDNEQG